MWSRVSRPLHVGLVCAVLALGPLVGCRCARQAEPPPGEDQGWTGAAIEPLGSRDISSAAWAGAAVVVGEPVREAVQQGETIGFELDLRAARHYRIAFDTTAVDLRLVVLGPGGEEVARAESPADRWGPESLSLVTSQAGTYRAEARHLPTASPSGELRLELADLGDDGPAAAAGAGLEQRMNDALALFEGQGQEAKQEALAAFRRVLADAEAESYPAERARALYFTALTMMDLGRFDEALTALEESGRLWSARGRADWEAEILFKTGVGRARAGDFRAALQDLERVMPVWQALGDRERQATALNELGFAYRSLGDLQNSLSCFSAALRIYRQLGLREREALGLLNLGATYRSLGDPDRALELYGESLATWQALGQTRDEAITLNNMGWCYKQLGQPERALDQFRQAFELAEQLGEPLLRGIFLGNMGTVEIELGRPRKALAACRAAYELSLEANARRSQALRLRCIGRAHLALGELDPAEAHLVESRELCRSSGDRDGLAEVTIALARLRRRQGRLEEAVELVDAALEIVEAVRTDVDIQSMRASYFAFQRAYYDLQIDLLMERARERPQGGFEARALQASERARARSLLELLAEADAGLRGSVAPELLGEERELRERINLLVRHRGDQQRPQKDSMAPELERLLEQVDELETRIRRSHPGYAELAYPRPIDLGQIQRTVLDRNSLLLEYSLGEERSWLWAVTPEALEVFELAPRSTIERQAREVYSLLSDTAAWRGGYRQDHETRFALEAAELSRLVLGPVQHLLQRQVLLVVAEGALSYVPFAALPKPAATARPVPLIVDHPIVSVPSASVLSVVRRSPDRPAVTEKAVLVFADPVFDRHDSRLRRPASEARQLSPPVARPTPLRSLEEGGWSGFERLRHTGEEARAIAELLPAASRTVLLGTEASRAMATSGEVADYRVLHFATHGVLDSRHPRLSGLVLSLFDQRGRPLDGVLRLHDIYDLDLRADLVVLSACQTGLGRVVRGEGIIGLTRGFLHAGADSVVASLWNVDDRATAELMRRFYQGLFADALTPSAALRKAQLELLRGEGGTHWTGAYYWAGFTLHGEWRSRRQPPREPQSTAASRESTRARAE